MTLLAITESLLALLSTQAPGRRAHDGRSGVLQLRALLLPILLQGEHGTDSLQCAWLGTRRRSFATH